MSQSKSSVIRVLVSAYSCCPGEVSEPGVAWRQLEALAAGPQFHFTVLTRRKNLAPIRTECARRGLTNIEAVAVDLPAWALFWKRGHLSMHLYYGIWQWLGWLVARRLMKQAHFDLAHHLSFMSVRTCLVPFLGVPAVIGPVGGAQVAPSGFAAILRHPIKERLRTAMIATLGWSPLWRKCIANTTCYMVANGANLWVVPEKYRDRVVVHQIGWELEPEVVRTDSANTPVAGGVLGIYWGGRLIGWKGLELLIRAAAIAKARGVALRIDVSGKGPDKDYLVACARNLGLEREVVFHGFLPFEEAVRLRNEADLVAFTSLHETTGTALMEAMVAGKATLVVDHAGPGEIAHEETSWKVPVQGGIDAAVQHMASGLIALASDPSRLTSMGKQARIRIANQFSWDGHIDFVRARYLAAVSDRFGH